MKLIQGKLMFEEGDVFNVEDTFGNEHYIVKKELNCSKCEFYSICDNNNSKNLIARFCIETHFEKVKK